MLLQPASVHAGFIANNLIDDSVFDNTATMNAAQIDAFLNGFPNSCISTNNHYQAADPTGYSPSTGFTYGGNVSAGTIIYHAAQAYDLNPQVIISTLEKESSVVSGSASYHCTYLNTSMGYDCPDSGSCPRNPATESGFSKQIIHAAWLMKFGEQRSEGNTGWSIQKPGWNNSDDPSTYYGGPMTQGTLSRCASCSATYFDGYTSIDGTSVHMDTGATATLYWYTPHFHGNQLFVSIFESWFGSTHLSFSIVKPSDSGAQYVLDNGVLYHIPSPDVIYAWGFDKLSGAINMDPGYINSLPRGPDLGRLVTPNGGPFTYLVDGGQKWVFPSVPSIKNWGMDPATTATLPVDLVNYLKTQGVLTNTVNGTSNNGIWLMDGGVVRKFNDPTILQAWAGEVPNNMTISSNLFTSYAAGADVTAVKFTSPDGSSYLADGGNKLSFNSDTNALYNLPTISASQALADSMVSSSASQFIQQPGQPTIYVMDNGQKRAMSAPQYVQAFSADSNAIVSMVNSGVMAQIPNGSSFPSSFVVTSDSQHYYLIDGHKVPINSNTISAYTGSTAASTVNVHLLNLLTTIGQGTLFIRAINSPTVYLLDYGTLHPFSGLTSFVLWGGASSPVVEVSPSILSQFNMGNTVGYFVSANGSNYAIQNGSYYLVDSNTQSNWGLNNPLVIDGTTLGPLSNGGNLTSMAMVGSTYYLVRGGNAFSTTNQDMASLWILGGASPMSSLLINQLSQPPLTRFVRSTDPNDGRIFVMEKGKLLLLHAPQEVFNLGYQGEKMVALSPAEITSVGVNSSWDNVTGEDGAGTVYVFDNGQKRNFSDMNAQNQWLGGNTPITLSNNFLNLLPTNNDPITKSFRAYEPAVYAVYGGTKRHVDSPSTASNLYSPESLVSPLLRDSLPTGTDIP